jgi:hypothetical protein
MGVEDANGVLPPHPRPSAYRSLLYAMAEWVEEQEIEKLKLVVESNGMKLKNTF